VEQAATPPAVTRSQAGPARRRPIESGIYCARSYGRRVSTGAQLSAVGGDAPGGPATSVRLFVRSTRRRSPILLTLAMLLAACGAAPPRVPTAAQIEAGPHVEVSVDPALDAERARAFEEHDGTTQLRNATIDELARTGKADSLHGAALRVVVTRFRLRSTGSGVWLGAMAGADTLDVSVTLEREGATQRTFQTGVGGIVAGLVKPSASGRFNGLLREVAKRVIAQL
jgi:hypothetical protein